MASECDTVKFASVVQLSSIEVIPAKDSKPATVVSAAGTLAEPASQPSTVTAVAEPVKTGACVSSTLMVCVNVSTFPHSSSTS